MGGNALNVHILRADADCYEGFAVVNEDDLDRKLDGFRGLPMADEWMAIPIKPSGVDPGTTALPASDFPSFGGTPVFSARAVSELHDLLDGRGELLPLESPQGRFFAFNVTRLSDALDEEHTIFRHYPDGEIMNIDTYEFIPERLTGATIFKLPQIPEVYEYVTDTFVERVRECDLKGFLFQQVWPNAVD